VTCTRRSGPRAGSIEEQEVTTARPTDATDTMDTMDTTDNGVHDQRRYRR
jgi:hypothetical protein